MNIISKLATKVSGAFFGVSCAALLIAMFLTTCDVILRRLGYPLAYSNEIVVIMAGIIAGFSLPQSILERIHVQMDFLTLHLGKKVQAVLTIITRFFAAGLLLILGWSMIVRGQSLKRVGQTSAILEIPDYPVAFGLGLCCLLSCVALFIALILDRSKNKSSEGS